MSINVSVCMCRTSHWISSHAKKRIVNANIVYCKMHSCMTATNKNKINFIKRLNKQKYSKQKNSL